jgi:hypothetical protein
MMKTTRATCWYKEMALLSRLCFVGQGTEICSKEVFRLQQPCLSQRWPFSYLLLWYVYFHGPHFPDEQVFGIEMHKFACISILQTGRINVYVREG